MDSSAPFVGHAPVEPARWYRVVGVDPHGPVGIDTIRRQVLEGLVTADTLVWADGMPDWMPARQVPALIPPQPWRSQLGWPATGESGSASSPMEGP